MGPDSRSRELAGLIERPFAHRGLHGDGRIENSLAAFEAAIEAGMGIELDVQISLDGDAVIFHDERVDRLTEASGAVAELSAAALSQIRLAGSDGFIPTLRQGLALIAGRVPLLIELKTPGRRVEPLCRAVLECLQSYSGRVAPMSFNPQVGAWFARRAPDRLRGLVVTERDGKWHAPLARRLALWRAKPDFLAYDIRDLPSSFAARHRQRGIKLLTWTCRSEEERRRAALHTDQIIYEVEQGPGPNE